MNDDSKRNVPVLYTVSEKRGARLLLIPCFIYSFLLQSEFFFAPIQIPTLRVHPLFSLSQRSHPPPISFCSVQHLMSHFSRLSQLTVTLQLLHLSRSHFTRIHLSIALLHSKNLNELYKTIPLRKIVIIIM